MSTEIDKHEPGHRRTLTSIFLAILPQSVIRDIRSEPAGQLRPLLQAVRRALVVRHGLSQREDEVAALNIAIAGLEDPVLVHAKRVEIARLVGELQK
jgi:hypothetical protein